LPTLSNIIKQHKVDTIRTYTTIRHNICLKTVLYFCKRSVLKVLYYQNIYAEKQGRNVHVYIFIGDHVE